MYSTRMSGAQRLWIPTPVLELRMAVSHHVCAGNRVCVLCKSSTCALHHLTIFPASIVLSKFKLSYTASLRPAFYTLNPVFKKQKHNTNSHKKSLWKECYCRGAHGTWLLPRARLASLLNSGIPNISDNTTASLASHNNQWRGGGDCGTHCLGFIDVIC